jgi:glycerol-3-phosphate dehydrogenase
MPNVFAMTAGPILSHRSAGKELASVVAKRLAPSREPREISYAARHFPENQNSPPLLDDYPPIRLADLRFAAEHEQVTNLVDLLIRRTGAAYTQTMGYDAAATAAQFVADLLAWDSARIEAETRAYQQYLTHFHGYSGARAETASVVAADPLYS